ncbi:MAG: leucyl aminopeptidase family protein, partial [Alphaproteobacteria bacterium]
PHRIARALRYFVLRKREKLPATVAVWLGHVPVAELGAWAGAVAYGIGLGLYRHELLKTDARTPFPLEGEDAVVELIHPQGAQPHLDLMAREWQLAKVMHHTFDLVNTPSNIKTPAWLAEQAEAAGRRAGFRVQVYDEQAIREMGLHALMAVGQGSAYPPRFIVMEYAPAQPRKKVALVGKGITFDTGGLSIKPAQSMHLMKSDMGGAAAVIGTLEAAALLRLPVHLVGIVPAAENAVDGKSLKPGDVIRSYSGKTIEVIDTDAEGRLVLADGLAWAVDHHQPDVLVDLATLTGSCIRALGTEAAGLFSPNDALADALAAAGMATGERLWRLPLWDEYMDYLKTDVADINNLGDKPMA